MKKLTLISCFLCLILISCKEYNEVRIMPEFSNGETEITLYKNIGSSTTVVINTTANDIVAEYDAEWLSVDINKRRVVYTVTAVNETGEPRTAIVKLCAGDWIKEVTVTQREIEESEVKMLKVGDLTEDGLGMVFWVDPENPEVGKAISLQRQGGKAFETSVKLHNAFSTVNGMENTALYTDAGVDDAVTFCISLGEGWYLPASEELLDLFEAYNGVRHTDPSFTNATPDKISDAEKAARAAFDKKLTDLGGTVINAAAETGNGESYWSSTENEDGQKARYVRFGKYGLDYGAKTGTARYARAMKVIGNYKFPEEPATLTISPTEVSLTSEEGATAEVFVTTNKATFTFVVEGDAGTWLSVTQENDKLVLTTLSANTDTDVRTATLTIVAGTGDVQATVQLTVIQQKVIVGEPFVIGEFVTKDKDVELANGGVVFWVDPTDPMKAKIVSLRRESLQWTTGFAATLGATDSDDGYTNTQTIAQSEHVGDIPAIEYCQAEGDGWYWPAKNELVDLYDAYNGNHSNSALPNDLPDEEMAARIAFDKFLTDNGGIVLNEQSGGENGDSYWSSTETSNGKNGFYVRFGKFGSLNNSKTGSARYVRCIRKVAK